MSSVSLVYKDNWTEDCMLKTTWSGQRGVINYLFFNWIKRSAYEDQKEVEKAVGQ